MTDMGPCQYYLGMSVIRNRQNRIIKLSQRSYINKILTAHENVNRHSKSILMNSCIRSLPAPEGYIV